MNTLVVLFALASVACGSLVQVAQPPHHPAVVLDPHGRPLDTAEVINARAVHLQAKALEGHYAPLAHAAVVAPVAHSVVAAPLAHSVYAPAAAVSHQSRVDVRHSPAVVSHAIAAPVLAHSAYASPLLAHSAYASPLLAHGHYLKKRSLGHLAYSAPIIAAPAAVSHQSRVDVISEPAVVSHAVAAPVYAHAAPVYAHAAPVYAHAAPVYAHAAAVSHQSRVDVRTSPAVVSHSVVAPVAHSVYAATPLAHSVYSSPLLSHAGLAHGHYLKKRSLGHLAYSAPIIAAPSAVSHQSRVDVFSEPAVVSHAVAAPVYAHAAPVYAHAAPVVAVAPAAVSHQSRVDVRTSPAVVSHSVVAPVAHSVYAAPVAHSSFWSSPLSHLARAVHW